MNNDPNSDLNNAQNSALHQVRSSRVHCGHTACAVAHTLRAQCPYHGRCCAHNKLVAPSACAGNAHSAQVVAACRDLSPLPSSRPSRDIISRSRPPRQLSQVATSIPRRDLPSAQPKPPRSRPQKWGRDTSFHRAGRTMSRHQIGVATPLRPIQVATPNQVATLLEATLCRDINFMS